MTTTVIPILSVNTYKGNKVCLCNESGVLYIGTLAQCYKIKQKIEKHKKVTKLRRNYNNEDGVRY